MSSSNPTQHTQRALVSEYNKGKYTYIQIDPEPHFNHAFCYFLSTRITEMLSKMRKRRGIADGV